MAYLKTNRNSANRNLFLIILVAAVGFVLVLAVRAGGTQTLESFDSAAGWSASSPLASATGDSDNKKEGLASVRFQSPESVVISKSFPEAKNLSQVIQLRLWSRANSLVQPKTDISSQAFNLRLSTTTNDYYQRTFVLQPGTWQEIALKPSDWTAVGSPSWSSISKMAVVASQPLDVNLDSFRFVVADAQTAVTPPPSGGNTTKTTTNKSTSKQSVGAVSTETPSATTASSPENSTGEEKGVQADKPDNNANIIFGSVLAAIVLLGLGAHLGWGRQVYARLRPLRLRWTKFMRRFR